MVSKKGYVLPAVLLILLLISITVSALYLSLYTSLSGKDPWDRVLEDISLEGKLRKTLSVDKEAWEELWKSLGTQGGQNLPLPQGDKEFLFFADPGTPIGEVRHHLPPFEPLAQVTLFGGDFLKGQPVIFWDEVEERAKKIWEEEEKFLPINGHFQWTVDEDDEIYLTVSHGELVGTRKETFVSYDPETEEPIIEEREIQLFRRLSTEVFNIHNRGTIHMDAPKLQGSFLNEGVVISSGSLFWDGLFFQKGELEGSIHTKGLLILETRTDYEGFAEYHEKLLFRYGRGSRFLYDFHPTAIKLRNRDYFQ